MDTEISPQKEIEQTSHPFNVAFTETGTTLEPQEGLRRFLIDTHERIKLDRQHFTEELFSDIFALYETGTIAAEAINASTKSIEDDPIMSSLALSSTVAAVYLLHSINSQRGSKEHEYRRALKLFVEFEQDIHNVDNGETKEERREVAIENLRDKMRHSGLQFVNLSDEQHRFHKAEFREIAQKKGIGEPISFNTVKKVGAFLQSPFHEKVAVTGEALSYVMFQGERSAGFLGKVASEYLKNPFRMREVGKSATMGFREASRLNVDLECQKSGTRHDNIDKQTGSLTLDQLHSVNLGSIQKIGYDWPAEDRDDLIKIMRDHEKHEHTAVRAKKSLYVQSAFMGLQLALIPIKLLSEEHRHTVGMNIYSFFAPMGPLRGFADELKAERAKANSKLADKADRLGRILGIDAHTQTSEEQEIDDDDDFDPDDPPPTDETDFSMN